jgi:hypothetical protein
MCAILVEGSIQAAHHATQSLVLGLPGG